MAVHAYQSPGSPTGHINDFANVLNADAKSSLEQSLSNYEQASGHQVAVAIIPELKDETIETYAFKLFREWGIGSKGKNDGVLFLISLNDREMKVEVGYGLEGALTDIESGNIVDNIVPPYFKAGDYAGGILAGLEGIKQAIGGELESSASRPKARRSLGEGWGNYFWIGIGLFMWLTSILARSRSWWAGGVIGAVAGGIIWLVWSMIFTLPILVVGGLLLDYIVSKKYKQAAATGNFAGLWWMGGGKHPWDKGGSWGGFGGGMSGGGGASGRW